MDLGCVWCNLLLQQVSLEGYHVCQDGENPGADDGPDDAEEDSEEVHEQEVGSDTEPEGEADDEEPKEPVEPPALADGQVEVQKQNEPAVAASQIGERPIEEPALPDPQPEADEPKDEQPFPDSHPRSPWFPPNNPFVPACPESQVKEPMQVDPEPLEREDGADAEVEVLSISDSPVAKKASPETVQKLQLSRAMLEDKISELDKQLLAARQAKSSQKLGVRCA